VDAIAEERAGTSPRSRDAGFVGAVPKPFIVEEFLATLQSAVRSSPPAESDAVAIFSDPSGGSPAEWAKADFFGATIHELKTPLTTISGQMQRARKLMTSDPARGRAAMDLALMQIGRMESLIAGLHDALRLRSNAMSLEVVTFDLCDAVAEAIIRHDLEETARFRFDYSETGPRVRGDTGRIAQILDNVLGNALKYSPPGAPVDVTVTIAAAKHGFGLRITVWACQRTSATASSRRTFAPSARATLRGRASVFTSAGGSPSNTVDAFG